MLNKLTQILKYTFSNPISLISLVMFFFFFEFDVYTSLILTVILGAILFNRASKKGRRTRNHKQTNSNTPPLQRVSPDKETFYRQNGLSREEINLFRETMHTAREQIYTIEQNMDSRTKLKAISKRNDTIEILKDFFRHIVEQPQRLHEVGGFLYTHLPNLKELTETYLEIDNHVAKSKKTYLALEKSATTIDEMCKLIRDDYLMFMSNDLDNMNVELELAKHVLNRDNNTNDEIKEPSENEL